MGEEIEELCAQRLRDLRRSRGLTLDQCESMSGGEIKAVVLGSYERGSRAISLARLTQLAHFYEVPLEYFLASMVKAHNQRNHWSFDLRALRNFASESTEITAVKTFLNSVAAQRQDWAGEFMTIRESDGNTMEVLLTSVNESLFERLRLNKLLLSN
jgi:transcriptional regulator with XRE-family HTH domain